MSRYDGNRSRQAGDGYTNGYGNTGGYSSSTGGSGRAPGTSAGGGGGGAAGGGVYGGYDYRNGSQNEYGQQRTDRYGDAPLGQSSRRVRSPSREPATGLQPQDGYNSYGGYATDNQPQSRSRGYSGGRSEGYESSRSAQPRRDRSRSRERRGDRSATRARSNTARGYGGTRQLDDILRVIDREWDFMTDDNCIPVKVALELMDTSSLGLAHRYDGFKRMHHELQHALKAIVNDHHQSFNTAVATFHAYGKGIQSEQAMYSELADALIKAKQDLSTSKPEVKSMLENSLKYDKMLQTINQIEELQSVPEKLEAQITEKRFLTAVSILSNALKIMRQPEMMEIGALSDLRMYLGSQEASLADILVEELHNHLYLKSLYCNDRWKAYSAKDATEGIMANSASGPRPLLKYINATDFSKPMTDDTNANRNPEADSLNYIRLTLEALNNLGHLSNAIANVNQRLPVELNRLVDKTNREVDLRHPSALGGLSRKGYRNKTIDFGLADNDVRVAVVNDLLFTLYSKFEAVVEGHRVIYDVLEGITKREKLQDTQTWSTGFVEVWQLIQSEMRSLLHDYLTQTDSRTGATSAPKMLQNALSNVISGKAVRPKNRRMFKLSNTDTATIKGDQDDLEQILKASMPGLVSDSLRPAVSSTDVTHSSDGSATGHKLLVEPSVFNITLFLPPSLAFLNRLKEVVPVSSGIVLSSLTSFLDDFVVNVFHPSLEDTIRDLFAQATSDADAFHEDPQWATLSKHPVMKGTTAFLDLITAFCKMLDILPPDQAFGQLTMDLLTSYFDKCYEWYKELVAKIGSTDQGAHGDMKTSAQWALSDSMRNILDQVWLERGTIPETFKKETEDEIARITRGRQLESTDLISDRKTVHSLCILSTSMKWISSKVIQLRHVEDPENFSRNDSANNGRTRRRWTLINNHRIRDDTRAIYLPMTAETVSAFDGVIASYQELATTILYTLRMEVRTRTIYHLTQCLSSKNYCLEFPITSADKHILTLNADLIWFDEDITSLLPKEEADFVWCGISQLMSHFLVSQASLIKILNQNGADRMKTNILVLQQNLKNIEPTADLGRANRFYGLYNGGVKGLMRVAKAGQMEYDLNELRVLVELCFSEAINGTPGRTSAGAVQARQSLSENLAELAEIFQQ